MARPLALLSLCLPLGLLAADRTAGPLPAEKAARSAVLPDGFRMEVFAAEPMVVQPIGFAIDARGRVWVAEALNYGEWKPTGKDRVVILEDTTGDGKADRRSVFYEGFNYVTGIEVGFGGVWVLSPPKLYFVPDHDGDDKPDAEPEVVFDGIGYKESRHNLANGFTWGPDGWLYGGHGRTSPSDVGTPGTPADRRVHCDGGVYRIHPLRRVWENFADGTTNPWGVSFDQFGQCFVSNCVNPHLFHMIPGGHYEPWRNRPSSRFAYERLPTIADHLHYPGGDLRADLGKPETLALGGGHAHCGILVYRGGAFPKEYENAIFLCNVHGRRINHDVLRPRGSGYAASHAADFLIAADPWFMGVTLRTGLDGSVYVSDWSDTGECHTYKPNTSTGRIYRIRHESAGPDRTQAATPGDLTRLSDDELVVLQRHPNDAVVTLARRVLQERAAKPGWRGEAARSRLRQLALDPLATTPLRLRGLWACHVTGGVSTDDLLRLLEDPRPSDGRDYLRSWAIRLLCEPGTPDERVRGRLRELARSDPSPVVRLELASALQRLPLEHRWPIVTELVRHRSDATDANLPLMYWYAIEPLVTTDPERALRLALTAEVPLVRRFIARRLADEAAAHGDRFDLAPLVMALKVAPETVRGDLLAGTREGLRGRKKLTMPKGWPAVYAAVTAANDPLAREHAVALALIFGDTQALADLRQCVTDPRADPTERVQGLESLIEAGTADLAPLLLELLADPVVRLTALRGLAAHPHPQAAQRILQVYPQLTTAEKATAISVLTARKDMALSLLDAIESKIVPRLDVSAYAARQMFALGDSRLNDRIREVWGEVRETPAARQALIGRYKALLTPAYLKSANLANGRAVFSKTCQPCHRLHGQGGTIGPDLTGTNRSNLDYLLGNIIDPSAEVGRDYRMSVVRTGDDRVITGIVVERSTARVVVQTATERITLSPDEVTSVKDSPLSIMPEGQLEALTKEQVRDLVGYLMSPTQVPLPPQGQP
jgi:putative membrane-bound dehydrogenase-like protein